MIPKSPKSIWMVLNRKLLLIVVLLAINTACAPVQASEPTKILPTLTTPTILILTPSLTPTRTLPPTATSTPVPSPTSTATATQLTCLQDAGRIETTSLRSLQLKLPMEVNVYLPPCYDQLTNMRFPVLYLIHGMNNTESQWDYLGADEAADRLIQSGEAPPFLIIMPHDRLWKEPSETQFDEVFLDELIPWIDKTYRTQPIRQKRAVGGLSRGGAWAIHFGLGYWETFGIVGAHSAPIFWEDARELKTWLETIPIEQFPRIYLDIGEKDYLQRSNTWFEQELSENNIPHEYYLFPGYHEDAYWEAHVEDYLRWYTANW